MTWYYIYLIKNVINGKIYVGKTKNINLRKSQHKSSSKLNRSSYPIHNAIRKYGFENFVFYTIYQSDLINDINEKEIYYIQFFNSRDKNFGYNICVGGEGSGGFVVSDENKEKYVRLYSGEKSVRAKLSNEQVKKIRDEYCNSDLLNIDLSLKYGIGKSSIIRIINNESYKDPNYVPDKKLFIKKRINRLAKGSLNKSSKLSNEDILKIRELYAEKSLSEIAKKFGVTKQSVWNIIHNKTWKL